MSKRAMPAGARDLVALKRSPRSTFALKSPYRLRLARSADLPFLSHVQKWLEMARQRGDVVSVEPREELERAVRQRRAVLLLKAEQPVGFGMTMPLDEGRFVRHAALVVAPYLRGHGFGAVLQQRLVQLSRRRWPEAPILSLTLSNLVERLNRSLGYETVPYCDLSQDPGFWRGCSGCVHEGHLKRNQYQDCHCWAGMLTPPGLRRKKVIPKDARP